MISLMMQKCEEVFSNAFKNAATDVSTMSHEKKLDTVLDALEADRSVAQNVGCMGFVARSFVESAFGYDVEARLSSGAVAYDVRRLSKTEEGQQYLEQLISSVDAQSFSGFVGQAKDVLIEKQKDISDMVSNTSSDPLGAVSFHQARD